MKRENKCPKCGSNEVITNAEVFGQGDHSRVVVATCRKPDAIMFKGRQSSSVSAWVCTACGFVEFYADSPKDLKIVAA